MRISIFGSLLITYAVVQTIVLLVLLRFIDPYEREPGGMIALLALWGAVGATTISAAGNSAVQRLLPARIDEVFGNAISAPAVEEVAKGLALVVFVLLSLWARGRFGIPRFEGVTDGIVYGAAIGFGFAFTEDILYLLLGASQEGLESGLVSFLSRRDFFGVSSLRHAIYTSAFGLGLGLATWSRSRGARIGFPVLGLLVAILFHAINNGLVQVVLSVRYGLDETRQYLAGIATSETPAMLNTARITVGVVEGLEIAAVVGLAALMWLWIRHQREVIRAELKEEVGSGLISRTELDLIPSYWRRNAWYLQLMKTGQWERLRLLKRMHNELVDLAFLKRRSKGDPEGPAEVEAQRRLVARLKSQKLVFL